MEKDEGIIVRPRVLRSRGGAYLRVRVQVPGYLGMPGRWLVVEAATERGITGSDADRWTEFRYALPLDRPVWVLGSPDTTSLDLSRPLAGHGPAWIVVRAAVVWKGHIRINERRLRWSSRRRKWR